MGDAGGPDDPRAAAGGGGGPFRRGAATLRADAASPGPGDGGTADRAVAGLRGGDFEAAGDAAADRGTGRFPCGEPRRPAGGPGDGGLGDGG